MSGDNVSVDTAAAAFLDSMDDNGFLEGDSEYVAPEPTEVEEEEEEVEAEDQETEEEAEEDESDEDEDESEEEDKDADEEDAGDLFEVEIDGEAYEVNLEELKSGYLRQEAYVKRQTELEASFQEREQEVEQERAALRQEYENVVWSQAMELKEFQNLNWKELKELDPEEYRDKRLAFTEAQERFQATRGRVQEIMKLQQEAEAIKHQAHVKAQIELAHKLIPELKEEGFKEKLFDFGEKIGFTKEEIAGISDARELLVLNQARLYAESQVRRKEAEKKKVSKDLPPVLKPGAPKTAEHSKARKQKEALKALHSSNSVKDAARLFESSGIFD